MKKTGQKQFPIQKPCFFFHDFWMGTATAVFRRNMPCKNRIGKAFLLRRISVFDEDALKELSFFMCKDL